MKQIKQIVLILLVITVVIAGCYVLLVTSGFNEFIKQH